MSAMRCDECGAQAVFHGRRAETEAWAAGWRKYFLGGLWRVSCPACVNAFAAKQKAERDAARKGGRLL